jgi:CRISPR-associated endonuclease/helicase Cas3
MQQQMLPQAASTVPLTARQLRSGQKPKTALNAASHWSTPQVWLTAVLPQQQQRFRDDSMATVDVALLPTEDEDDYALHRIDPGKKKWESLYVQIENSQNHRIPDSQVQGARIEPWGETDYLEALSTLAESLEMSLLACAQRYGTVSLPDNEQGWRFHPALGFTRER